MQYPNIINKKNNRLYIYGNGGFAREVGEYAFDCGYDSVVFVDTKASGDDVISENNFDPTGRDVIIAISNTHIRKSIVERLGYTTCNFISLIHPTAYVRSENIGLGTVICPYASITTNVWIGNFVHINLSCTVGHDSSISDYVTLSPMVSVSGNCTIHKGVYIGTHASVRERVAILPDITVGMGSVVVKTLDNRGATYVGNPAKLLNK